MDPTEYAARWPTFGDPSYRWHPRNAISVAYRQQQERAILRAVDLIPGFPDVDVLDVGCGGGSKLRYLAELFVPLERLHGIDMVPERIEAARSANPAIDVRVGDATVLPWPDQAFDVVTQFVTFSMIPPELRPAAAGEMLRVLRPGGSVLWFDLVRPADTAPSGLPVGDVERLWPGVRWLHSRHLHHRFRARTASWGPLNDVFETLLPRMNVMMVGRLDG